MDNAHWGIDFTFQIIFMAMLEKVAGIHFALIETENGSVSCSGIFNSKTINNNNNNDLSTKGHVADMVTWSHIQINSINLLFYLI